MWRPSIPPLCCPCPALLLRVSREELVSPLTRSVSLSLCIGSMGQGFGKGDKCRPFPKRPAGDRLPAAPAGRFGSSVPAETGTHRRGDHTRPPVVVMAGTTRRARSADHMKIEVRRTRQVYPGDIGLPDPLQISFVCSGSSSTLAVAPEGLLVRARPANPAGRRCRCRPPRRRRSACPRPRSPAGCRSVSLFSASGAVEVSVVGHAGNARDRRSGSVAAAPSACRCPHPDPGPRPFLDALHDYVLDRPSDPVLVGGHHRLPGTALVPVLEHRHRRLVA